jgi:hypothetical protein
VDLYRFRLAVARPVHFFLESPTVDTVLLFMDSECALTASNDDCTPAEHRQSCLTLDLEAGTYFVGVSSFTPQGGDYALSVECRGGGGQRPGDCNQDRRLDISDGICILGYLFQGTIRRLPCGNGGREEAGNRRLLDLNGDTRIDLADAVYSFRYLFYGGLPPVQGVACIAIPDCPERCN